MTLTKEGRELFEAWLKDHVRPGITTSFWDHEEGIHYDEYGAHYELGQQYAISGKPETITLEIDYMEPL